MNKLQLEAWDRQLRALTANRAVAVAFVDSPPEGLRHCGNAVPSGCTFWKLTAQGESFYAQAADHLGCTIGAYTHGAEMPPEKTAELSGLIETMTGLSYLQAEEVPRIPRRTTPLRFTVYAPLGEIPVSPDVVLVQGNARQLMLLSEAARAAGHLNASTVMGRPACAMIPHSLSTGEVVVSLGCIGNRVYTGLGDDQGYAALPGQALEGTMVRLETIVVANERLDAFHRQRQARPSG
jgi:uncharacterized protein (DUF169 family)